MRRELAKLEAHRAKFAALGKAHVEIPQRTLDPRFNCVIEWEPIRSKQTGAELAAVEDVNITQVRAEIARAETEIEELLAQ